MGTGSAAFAAAYWLADARGFAFGEGGDGTGKALNDGQEEPWRYGAVGERRADVDGGALNFQRKLKGLRPVESGAAPDMVGSLAAPELRVADPASQHQNIQTWGNRILHSHPFGVARGA